MALIKCEECGHMISDKAIACPKCGCPSETMNVKPPQCEESFADTCGTDDYRGLYQEDPPKNNRTGLIFVVCAIVVVAVGAMYALHVKKVRSAKLEEQARLDSIAAVEQARITEEQRRDSLYLNFTTSDLNTFQVKGFVKSITMGTSCVCAGGYKQYITINFNTSGIVTSAVTSLQLGGYSQNFNMITVKSGDYANKLVYGTKKIYEDEECVGETTGYFTFGCNNDRLEHVKVYFRDTDGDCIDMVDADISFSEFSDKGLPSTINYRHDRCTGTGFYHSYSSYTGKINYPAYDDHGNWTQMSIGGNLTDMTMDVMTNEVENQKTYWYTVTLPRTITYYTREEIFDNDTEEDF